MQPGVREPVENVARDVRIVAYRVRIVLWRLDAGTGRVHNSPRDEDPREQSIIRFVNFASRNERLRH